MDPFELLVQAHRPAMKAVLARLIELFRANDVRYVIGGANALSLYARPRMTIDIDAFVDAARKADVDRMLARLRADDVEIDIRYAGSRAEDFALASARDAVILGTPLKAASPEALLWLYLVSKNEQNAVDAVQLLRAQGEMDVNLVRRELERHDPDALARLDKTLSTARQPTVSYEASRASRS